MKKFKILHLPTALYVWECPDSDDRFFMGGYHTIFNCKRKAVLETYLSEQKCIEITDKDVLLWNELGETNMPFKRHEFEIIGVTDEEVV